MKAFVSHITEEAATAQALKRELERALPGVRVFAGDIGLGEMWQATLSAELSNARAILVLCSPRSVERSWVNFESGAGTADALGVARAPTFDAFAMTQSLTQALPARQSDIGIVLTHGQDKWNRSRSSPFEFPAALRAARAARWSFRPIRQQDDLLSGQLHTLTRDQRGGS